jgi:hypothetical protein
MNEEIKQVWVAAARVEMLQTEMDQAQAALDSALAEAVVAGAALDHIGLAANLAGPELGRRIRSLGAPVSAGGAAVPSSLQPLA